MIKPNFEGADGSAAFISELAKAEKKIDNFENQYSRFSG
jgi:hypothetical protein